MILRREDTVKHHTLTSMVDVRFESLDEAAVFAGGEFNGAYEEAMTIVVSLLWLSSILRSLSFGRDTFVLQKGEPN
jgi:hypothetical protein